jgi:hypothetical protein
MSILSRVPDDVGFYYGFIKGDGRQVNVRLEQVPVRYGAGLGQKWFGYVGGEKVTDWHTSKESAEAAAVAWAKANPEED